MQRRLVMTIPVAVMLLISWAWTIRVMGAQAASAHGLWSMAPSMPAPVTSHQAVVLHDGRVLVIGGEPVEGYPVP